MTPPETELLHQLGITYLSNVEELSIGVFFYGASSLLMVYGLVFTTSIKGAFVVLFSASVVIFVFVFSFLRVGYFLVGPDPPRFHRRRGFSNRPIAAVFVVTVINFLLLSLSTGTEIAMFILLIRKALILGPLSGKQELIDNVLRNLNIVSFWSANLPVSRHLLLLDSVSKVHSRWRYCSAISLSFGGLGPFLEVSKNDSGSSSYHLCCGL